MWPGAVRGSLCVSTLGRLSGGGSVEPWSRPGSKSPTPPICLEIWEKPLPSLVGASRQACGHPGRWGVREFAVSGGGVRGWGAGGPGEGEPPPSGRTDAAQALKGAAGRVSCPCPLIEAQTSLGPRPGEDSSPFCPSAPLGLSGRWGVHRLGDHRGLAGPHPPVCWAVHPVHGPAEAGLWRECLGSGSCPTPAHWPWGPETTFSPVRRAPGRRRTAHHGRIYFPFDFQPFQESAYPPPLHILLGTCLFSPFISVAVVNGEGVCHRWQMGPSKCWPGGSVRASLLGPSGREVPVPGCPAAGVKGPPGRLRSASGLTCRLGPELGPPAQVE